MKIFKEGKALLSIILMVSLSCGDTRKLTVMHRHLFFLSNFFSDNCINSYSLDSIKFLNKLLGLILPIATSLISRATVSLEHS